MNRFIVRRLVSTLCTAGILGISSQAQAAAFQLWEQDGASVGNYHAGYAALANDASIAWYNPAGMTRIQNQQVVVGVDAIMSDFRYRGSVTVTEMNGAEIFTSSFPHAVAQGGAFNIVPDLHYVAPITNRLSFGFSVDAPFGLKTDYGRDTPVKYASVLTSIRVIDISPSLAYRITDKGSIGAGFDAQVANAEFNTVGTLTVSPLNTDTDSRNKAHDTGYGYHLGALYEFTPCLRAGVSYHSHVFHDLKGHSRFTGIIADIVNDDKPIKTGRSHTKINLPGYTAFSVFDKFDTQWAIMGTVVYTQWKSFKTLALHNVAGVINGSDPMLDPITASKHITVVIPEHYRNSWNASIGLDYYPTDTATLRVGFGYDETPVRNKYRNTQLPDNDRYVASFGGHYQATKAIGLDAGYFHVFFKSAHINPPPQVMGAQTTLTKGSVKGGADVIGTQLTWNIA